MYLRHLYIDISLKNQVFKTTVHSSSFETLFFITDTLHSIIHKQYTSNTHAIRMQYACNTHAIHKQCTFYGIAIYSIVTVMYQLLHPIQ